VVVLPCVPATPMVKELSEMNYKGIVCIKSTVKPGTTEILAKKYSNLNSTLEYLKIFFKSLKNLLLSSINAINIYHNLAFSFKNCFTASNFSLLNSGIIFQSKALFRNNSITTSKYSCCALVKVPIEIL
jgi:hypothetical protein